MDTILKKLFWALLVASAVFVLLNFQYFSKNLAYYLAKPSPNITVDQTSSTLTEPNLLIIESLSIRVPIQYTADIDENKFQQALANGVVHFPGTASIGHPGNAYIFGHSSDFLWTPGHYKTAFATLPKIKIGDRIIVTNPRGESFAYEVKETKIVAKDDLSVLAQDYSKKLLTLQTSWPVGTALKRFVVMAELMK